jgi:hypothetical protein
MRGTSARLYEEASARASPLRKTLTDNRGKEMAEHEWLARRLGIRVSAQPVATRHQREHQWLAPVSAQGYELVGLHPAPAEYIRSSVEHSTEKMPALGHPSGGGSATASSFNRCTWTVKSPLCSCSYFALSLKKFIGI